MHLTIGSIVSFDDPGNLLGSSNLSEIPLPPRLTIQVPHINEQFPQDQGLPTVFIDCALPQLCVSLHKSPSDGVQLWVDDFSQWTQRLAYSAPLPGHYSKFGDGNSIGSRFFARQPANSLSSSTTASSRMKGSTLHKDSPNYSCNLVRPGPTLEPRRIAPRPPRIPPVRAHHPVCIGPNPMRAAVLDLCPRLMMVYSDP